MSTVSVDPTVVYRPNPLSDELGKESMLGLSSKRDAPAGILTKLIKKKVFEVPVFGESCINKLTVTSAVACVLAIDIELMLLTPFPGASNSISTPEATPL